VVWWRGARVFVSAQVQRTMLELLNQLDGFSSNDDVKVGTPRRHEALQDSSRAQGSATGAVACCATCPCGLVAAADKHTPCR
jgi:hypothetical protein